MVALREKDVELFWNFPILHVSHGKYSQGSRIWRGWGLAYGLESFFQNHHVSFVNLIQRKTLLSIHYTFKSVGFSNLLPIMSETLTTRAVRASPLLLVAGLMFRAFLFVEPVGDVFAGFLKRGVFSLNDVEIPILKSFYGIPLLDEILTHTTLAFAQLQLWPADQVAWWHSLVFLTDFAAVYAICLLESCRPTSKGTLLQL